MANIFVSHSAKDRQLVSFFNNCRGTSHVGLVWEEIEKTLDGHISADKIRADIEQSKAVFIILTANVESLQHTRDWVTSEAGAASKKDVWVFEQIAELGQISVVLPFTRHYVLYEPTDAWIPYIRSIIDSYDDSHVLPTVAIGGGVGALSGKLEWTLAGLAAGIAIANMSYPSRPPGKQTICDHCKTSYYVHLPDQRMVFRCPVCNVYLRLPDSALPTLGKPMQDNA
jgi:hypothetical protein